MAPNLSTFELEILGKLVNGEAVSVRSQHRVRLELAGLIREGAKGILVTAEGRRLAGQQRANARSGSHPTDPKVTFDKRGRRMPFQRRSVF